MSNSKKVFSWKGIATIIGVGLLSLAVLDAAMQWKSADFGVGVSTQVTSQSVFAFLLVGMIVGMLCGIIMAFSYFMWKEKKLEEKPDELAQLLDELSKEEYLYVDENHSIESEDKGETLEPWERPTDWWKSEDE